MTKEIKKEQHNVSEDTRILQQEIRNLTDEHREFKKAIKELKCINEKAMNEIYGLKHEEAIANILFREIKMGSTESKMLKEEINGLI